jgi:hypothetical protein
MVKIIAAHMRKSEKGEFISLELMGDLEMVQSQNTGRFYATTRKCFLSTTFNAETAKSFIGQTLQGDLRRVSCEPYTYKVSGTGEEITLSHTYTYLPPETKPAHTEEETHFLSEVEQLRSIDQY